MLSFEQVIQNLTDTTQPSIVRCSAIANLISQGSSEGIRSLIEVLADSDSMVRREAAMALRQMDATRAAQPLLEALQVESNDLTLWAMLEAVGELATPDALPMLESLRAAGPMLTRIEVKKSIARIEARYANGSTSTSAEASEPELHHERIEAHEPSATEDLADTEITPEEDPGASESNVPHDSTEDFQETTSDDLFIEELEDVATVESHEKQPTEFEEIFTTPSVDPDEGARSTPEEITDIPDYTESADEQVDVLEETESADEVTDALDYVQFDDESNPPIDEIGEDPQSETPTETSTTDTESTHREKEDQEINDLAESIARSSRLAGSSVNLPVLAPNASTVPYDPKGTALESAETNFFLTLIHPGRYLSKQWMQRTRVYPILWAVLVIVTIAFTQYQKHTKIELSPLSRFGLSISKLPELVKRSLAEGDFYIQEGYYRKAINSYELSRGLGALPVSFYRKLGFAYFKEGQYALAVEAYELFLEAKENENPDVFAAEASLVGVYPLTSVGEGTTRDYETYNILGTAYMKLGRALDAQRTYEKAIHLAPKYGEAYNNLARLYAHNYPDHLPANINNPQVSHPLFANSVLQTSPRLRFAEALAYTAVTLNPDVAAYHDTLGWILSKRGQVNKGIKTLERAINLQSDAVEPHYHLAQVALKANERERAIKAIRNVFKLNPAFVSLNTAE
ncbi:HEAT repeat domain-containing protein [Candidatus Poribacteria bacterium]|nr:HEAT repeat domain-containing protein [Candidatus Poribacteria bacterium]